MQKPELHTLKNYIGGEWIEANCCCKWQTCSGSYGKRQQDLQEAVSKFRI